MTKETIFGKVIPPVKEKVTRLRDREVRIVDAVLVGTFIMIGVTGLILSQAKVHITFPSHEIHMV